MILIIPPTVSAQVESLPFDFRAFKATRIHPKSDPCLMAALNRLYEDSPSFRVMLARFEKEEPKVILHFECMEERTLGFLLIETTSDNYLITVGVQGKLARLGFDSLEPWLGLLLFGLFEICHKDGVVETKTSHYVFDSSTESHMWNYQQELRKELGKANSQPKLNLAPNGILLYRTLVLGQRYDLGVQN